MHFGAAYLAPEGFERQLANELHGIIIEQYGRLFLTNKKSVNAYWAQNIWHEPFIAKFESVSQAANILKGMQRNWALYPYTEHRRAALIQEKLPYMSGKPVQFPCKIPEAPLGSFALLDKNTLIASAKCSSQFPNGEIHFEECREGPPSRAYLKLWEALTLADKMPGKGDKCLEVGASPGGWTWVLANLGASILAVDRSELAPDVAQMPGVSFRSGNAFVMKPGNIGRVEWIFSDVACYPEKLLEWVLEWVESGYCQNFVCTLKFQGEEGYHIASEFAKIPGSRIVHLGYNKHELTFLRIPHASD